MPFYSVRNLTKFVYSNPVSESVSEVRMHPRNDSNQRCLTFALSVSPRCPPSLPIAITSGTRCITSTFPASMNSS